MKPVDYAQASPEVRAVYDDIMALRGTDDVNNFWKYLANDPQELEAVWSDLKRVMGPGALAPEVKELIYAAVSIANGCGYCIASHTTAARSKGASEEMIREMRRVVGMAVRTNALVSSMRVPVDDFFEV